MKYNPKDNIGNIFFLDLYNFVINDIKNCFMFVFLFLIYKNKIPF